MLMLNIVPFLYESLDKLSKYLLMVIEMDFYIVMYHNALISSIASLEFSSRQSYGL